MFKILICKKIYIQNGNGRQAYNAGKRIGYLCLPCIQRIWTAAIGEVLYDKKIFQILIIQMKIFRQN